MQTGNPQKAARLHVKIKYMKYFLPRFQDIFFLSIFFGALLLGPQMLSIDSDLGRHLTIGNYILDQQKIPTSDIFSYTKNGESRPPYEWLTQVLFAVANRMLGLDGVVLLTAMIIASAFTMVYVEAIRRSGWPLAAIFLSIVATSAGSIHWLPRPHIFTFLLLAIWIERLERLSQGDKIPLWHFPLIMLLWANMHGGFIFGILAWIAYFAGWTVDHWFNKSSGTDGAGKKLTQIGLLSLIASCITPDGWGNWQAVMGNSSVYILSQTIETMPPDFREPGIYPFLIFLVLTGLVLIINKFRFPASQLFLLAGFAILSFLMARNIPLFVISATPVLAASAQKTLRSIPIWAGIETNLNSIEHSLKGYVYPIAGVLTVSLLFSTHYAQTQTSFNKFDERVFPVLAANSLQEHPRPGNMFNEFNWGGYLLYRLWPSQRVFMDSQTDFYGEALTREYEKVITTSDGWQGVLEKYDIKWVMVSSDSPLVDKLSEAGWHKSFDDATTVILENR
jgi:hypothetical protein